MDCAVDDVDDDSEYSAAVRSDKQKNEKKEEKKNDKMNDKRSQAELNWNGNGNRAPRDGTRPQPQLTQMLLLLLL